MSSLLQYPIALSMLPRVGAVNGRRLVAYLGSAEAVFKCTLSQLKNIPGISEGMISNVLNKRHETLEKAKRELEFIQRHGIKTSFYPDKDYPRRLAQCEDAPVVLFSKGDINLNHQRIISIVGTRNATEYGRELTNHLLEELAKSGIDPLVVSGLAYGIDVAAHKAALKNQLSTAGVIAHGLDKMYPAVHASVAREMLANKGALISDFPSNTKIDPGNFLRRNRIIAGLADCTIVVESGEKGGALVTADIANSYNRDVFAFPGRTSDPASAGCNALIKNNKAAMIESAADLIAFMGWEPSHIPWQQPLLVELNAEEEGIVALLRNSEVATTDYIARSINLPVQKINSLLLDLEFKGLIKSLPGSRFKLLLK
ncbi:DNA-processing protein DprA [Roseimarinus sediminis]|uniref:DNA-processing protein DprA n=1 Tax=Roseimarinus sediminis TaxID=1610899 RepID=UPI003D204A0C